jgi:hypothetical protein
MKTKKLRPHLWIVQGHIPHEQYVAWHRARAQAHFRNEVWDLSFEQFQALWQGRWHLRGRSNTSWCLVREDPDGAWHVSNVDCIPRVEHIRRQALYKGKKNGKSAKGH